ncbi:MAG: hypothetical protein SNG10_02600, partial [Rikenellaceae bacterium]
MNVKFYFLTLVAALLAVSCVDSSYDLSKVSTDDFVIGDDNSEFEVPVATITLTSDNLQSGSSSSGGALSLSNVEVATRASLDDVTFTDILELINAFLPSGESVDIANLTDESTKEEEVTSLVEMLIDELMTRDSKCADLAAVLHSYVDDIENASEISEVLDYLDIDTTADKITESEIYDALIDLRSTDPDDIEEFKELLVAAILENLIVDLTEYTNITVEENIDPISIPSDVIDIISNNTEGANNSLSVVITIEHNFPFTFEIEAIELVNSYSTPTVKYLYVTQAGEESYRNEIDIDELTSILEAGNGATISTGINL